MPPPPPVALVTGGAGFIGSHLCEALLAGGRRVVTLDDLSTGRRANLGALVGKTGFELVADSVEHEHVVDLLVSRADEVYHLASAVGVRLILDRPVHTIRTIIRGTETVLAACARFGRPCVLTSSSEVYGKGSRVPFREDDDVVVGPTRHARWCYAYAKGIDEFLALAFAREHDLPVAVARLFNTVGPRQIGQYGMVLPRFADAALRGEPLQVYGDGAQTRTFCHVADTVDALRRLMAGLVERKASVAGEVFNVGGVEETGIRALAERVVRLAGSASAIEHVTYAEAYGQPFDDLPRRVPALDKIAAAVGFGPTRDLDAIVRSVLDDRRGEL